MRLTRSLRHESGARLQTNAFLCSENSFIRLESILDLKSCMHIPHSTHVRTENTHTHTDSRTYQPFPSTLHAFSSSSYLLHVKNSVWTSSWLRGGACMASCRAEEAEESWHVRVHASAFCSRFVKVVADTNVWFDMDVYRRRWHFV